MWFHTFFCPSKHLQLAPFLGWPCMGCSTRSIMQLEMKKTPLNPHPAFNCHFPQRLHFSSPRSLCLPWMAWGFISYKICLLYSAFHYEHRNEYDDVGKFASTLSQLAPEIEFLQQIRASQSGPPHPPRLFQPDHSSSQTMSALPWLCFVLRKSFFPPDFFISPFPTYFEVRKK